MADVYSESAKRVVGFAISSDKVRVSSGFVSSSALSDPVVLYAGQKALASGAFDAGRGSEYQDRRYRPFKASGRARSL